MVIVLFFVWRWRWWKKEVVGSGTDGVIHEEDFEDVLVILGQTWRSWALEVVNGRNELVINAIVMSGYGGDCWLAEYQFSNFQIKKKGTRLSIETQYPV